MSIINNASYTVFRYIVIIKKPPALQGTIGWLLRRSGSDQGVSVSTDFSCWTGGLLTLTCQDGSHPSRRGHADGVPAPVRELKVSVSTRRGRGDKTSRDRRLLTPMGAEEHQGRAIGDFRRNRESRRLSHGCGSHDEEGGDHDGLGNEIHGFIPINNSATIAYLIHFVKS